MKRCENNRGIRKLLNLSCQDLANRVETTRQTISNYELGKTNIRYLERVIEMELDLAIEECNDDSIKKCCKILKDDRVGA